uniref:Aminopeptidase n=1 Tax=Bursaphelenchus xylophilus TaxID=6326 RepID=A0A1I7SS45_BURXY
MRVTVLLTFLCIAVCSNGSVKLDANSNSPIGSTDDSLPHDVVVHQYDLKFTPYFNFSEYRFPEEQRNTFDGDAAITFSVLKTTFRVELTSAVNLLSTALLLKGQSLRITTIEHRENNHTIINADKALQPDLNYTLRFEFNGIINRPKYGAIYAKDYVDKSGNATSLLGTHFEAILAREAFPCFDDPYFKSIFVLTLVHPLGSKAYSNAKPAQSAKKNGQQSVTTFEPSVKMPTYLFAFGIGDLAESSTKSKRGVAIRTLASRNSTGRLDQSAIWAAKCLDIMEDTLKVNYPMDKLEHYETMEHIAGGMENFGFIIYQNSLTSYIDNDINSECGRAAVICHETAHQWFGDLVTGKRWGLEFLHEAFATYFQWEATKQIDQFSYSIEYSTILHAADSRNISQQENHPIADNISRFDDVTYSVGAHLLRTIQSITGENFTIALTNYQKKYSFQNADLDSLLGIFDEIYQDRFLGNHRFSLVMSDYFTYTGLPTIEVTLSDNGDYMVRQTSKGKQWDVPVIFFDIDNKIQYVHLIPRNATTFSTFTGSRNYLFNPGLSMFADVYVDDTVWDKILSCNTITKLSGLHQLSIVAMLSRSNPEKAAKFVHDLANLNNPIYPTLYELLFTLSNDVSSRPTSSERQLHQKIIAALAKKFDTKPTIENRVLGRSLLQLGVREEVPEAVVIVKKLFDQFIVDCGPGKEVTNCTQIPPEFRVAIFLYGKQTPAGEKFLIDYLQRLQKSPAADALKPEIGRILAVASPQPSREKLYHSPKTTFLTQEFIKI